MELKTTKTATIELLEKGTFIITRPDEQRIKGRFTMAAFDRFCTQKEIGSYFEMLKKIAVGMSIGDYADLLLIAFQDYYRSDPSLCPVTRTDVLDMIDDIGGISEEFMKLIMHAIGRISGDATDKKKINQAVQPKKPAVKKK